MVKTEYAVAASVGIALGLIATYKLAKSRSVKKSWILVGRVKALYVYPVKSFKFLSLTSAEVTPIGLKSGEYRDR